MVVQHNLTAINANRMLGITQGTLSKSTEKLSSGYKINRAADDAAGLSISEKMRKQIRGLTQASANAEDGISAVQTAEGALTEVHDMLQRMNELATKAATGTNSISDRQSIQDEVDQLLTEIDRVSETTKFNETYLLKGNADTKNVKVNAHDAGLDGVLTQNAEKATFTMTQLKLGDTISIGGVEYTIGDETSEVQDCVEKHAQVGSAVSIDGINYTVSTGTNAAKNQYTAEKLSELVADGSTVIMNGKTLNAMSNTSKTAGKDADKDNVLYADTTSVKKGAYALIKNALESASSIGTDSAATIDDTVNTGFKTSTDANGNDTMEFYIEKGSVDKKEGLSFSLHVGSDADGTNKISVNIDAISSAGLGIKGLNVKDDTGASATYAIDAISDAISKVSAQRSALGAVQNRLDHTINNLDNVVENTTSAESQIRDTDMATEMVKYSNANILAQAGQSMLAQANQSNQGVLSLLG
jgi:flagellin